MGRLSPEGRLRAAPRPGFALAKRLARSRGRRHHETLPGLRQVISRPLMRVELLEPPPPQIPAELGRKIGRKRRETAGSRGVIPKSHDHGIGSQRFLDLQPLENRNQPPGPALPGQSG